METNLQKKQGKQPATLLSLFESDLRLLGKRVNIDRTESTYVRRQQLRQYVADYVTDSLHVPDVPLQQLSENFIRDFSVWLSTTRQYRSGTIWLACHNLKAIVSRAYQSGLLSSNPFACFRVSRNIRPRQVLTEEELKLLSSYKIDDAKMAFHRDLFVFSALTGMAFADICHLRPSDIHVVNTQLWVLAKRHKTHTPFQMRLLPKAIDILCRYQVAGGENTVFGPIVYRTLAKHIPQIVKACGINKHVTFHCARHTFAVAALNAGLPMESISRIVGHANITTTQLYAKVTLSKLNKDIDLLTGIFEDNDKKD